jgi:hypothetical protein
MLYDLWFKWFKTTPPNGVDRVVVRFPKGDGTLQVFVESQEYLGQTPRTYLMAVAGKAGETHLQTLRRAALDILTNTK